MNRWNVLFYCELVKIRSDNWVKIGYPKNDKNKEYLGGNQKMNNSEKIIRNKVGLLNLAEELGNIQ